LRQAGAFEHGPKKEASAVHYTMFMYDELIDGKVFCCTLTLLLWSRVFKQLKV
jgi:hypothetical protein